ncbi:MAG: class I SAM-dependent methyltransferase [Candidatus Polarisedimenticolia bacterium]
MSGNGALKFYDRRHRRLVFIRRRADERYWDEHWDERDARAALDDRGQARFFVDLTRRHLPGGGRVLEGGCGLGEKLRALGRAGFHAHGVDTAAATLRRLRDLAPDLSLAQCDVRGLCFVDGSFDGYWSIGVIEHFYDGFTPLAREMQRVVRPGGFLFLTFPAMTPLRRLKAALRMYPAWNDGAEAAHRERFYQFALAEREVVARLEADHGFQVVARGRRGGMRGLKEEARFLHSLIKPVRRLLDPLIASLAGHSAVLVLRRV